MESTFLPPAPRAVRTAGPTARRRRARTRPATTTAVPDEPMAVVFAGPGRGRSTLLGGLLGAPGPVLDVAADSYLVVRAGRQREVFAYVPGSLHGQRREPAADLPAPVRPPRRVELRLPDPLLRHFALVDAPDTRRLSAAGARVLLDAARRGGAVVFVLPADRSPDPAEVEVLAALAGAGVRMFLVVTPGGDGRWAGPGAAGAAVAAGSAAADTDRGDPSPVSAAVAAHRRHLSASVPALAAATWFAIDPAAGDTAYLRRSLVEWAGTEGLRRAVGNPPEAYGAARTVPVGADAHLSAWPDRLTALTAAAAQVARQRLAIELAKIHLRCVQEIVFGAGCTGLPEALDRELHALSLSATAECEQAADRLVDDMLGLVVAQPLPPGVRHRFVEAVRRGVAEDPEADDLARVLLVTGTSGVAAVAGAEAVAAGWAYPPAVADPLLPAVGLALSAGCYRHWQAAGHDDVGAARGWVQRTLRGIELELTREVSHRFAALERSLGATLGEAVDHGMLLR